MLDVNMSLVHDQTCTKRYNVFETCFHTGETELEDEYDAYTDTLWIDMPMFSRVIHVLKQVHSQSANL